MDKALKPIKLNVEKVKCSCGYSMKIRINYKTKEPFWGCRNYPKCKNTKPLIIKN